MFSKLLRRLVFRDVARVLDRDDAIRIIIKMDTILDILRTMVKHKDTYCSHRIAMEQALSDIERLLKDLDRQLGID